MFEIKNLSVKIGEKQILNNLSLALKAGEVHAVMGPNGAGKSTLACALLGHPLMKIDGKILLDGEDLSAMPTDERAQRGLFLAFQNPQEIEGVTIANLIRKAKLGEEKDKRKMLEAMMKIQKDIEHSAQKMGVGKEFLKRDLNVGFSGGEKKRNEMLQMIALNPRVIIIDEIDSGLDIDALKMVSGALNEMRSPNRCFLLITHYERILEYVKPDFVHIMKDGKIAKSGNINLALQLVEKGYDEILKQIKTD